MTLQEIKQLVLELSYAEKKELRAYIGEIVVDVENLPLEQRIHQLEEAAREIRAGMTQNELEMMFADMDSEYIEPLDDDSWID
jgi:hypothetical protein